MIEMKVGHFGTCELCGDEQAVIEVRDSRFPQAKRIGVQCLIVYLSSIAFMATELTMKATRKATPEEQIEFGAGKETNFKIQVSKIDQFMASVQTQIDKMETKIVTQNISQLIDLMKRMIYSAERAEIEPIFTEDDDLGKLLSLRVIKNFN